MTQQPFPPEQDAALRPTIHRMTSMRPITPRTRQSIRLSTRQKVVGILVGMVLMVAIGILAGTTQADSDHTAQQQSTWTAGANQRLTPEQKVDKVAHDAVPEKLTTTMLKEGAIIDVALNPCYHLERGYKCIMVVKIANNRMWAVIATCCGMQGTYFYNLPWGCQNRERAADFIGL